MRWLKEELVRTNNFEEYNRGLVTTLATYDQYIEAIRQAVVEMERLRKISAELVAQDFGVSPVSSEGAASFRMNRMLAGEIAPGDLTEAERDYRMAVGDSAERVRILQAVVDAAAIGTNEWIAAMTALSGAQLDLAGDVDAVKKKILDLKGDIEQYQLSMRLGAAGSDSERLAILQGR